MHSVATYEKEESYLVSFDPANVKPLNRIVEAVSPRIVLIAEIGDGAALFDHYSLDELREEFKKVGGLGEIIGTTGDRTDPDDADCPVEITTGEVIDGWIEDHFGQFPAPTGCNFAILGCRGDLDKHRDRFVQTSSSTGLTDQDADRVIELLKQKE